MTNRELKSGLKSTVLANISRIEKWQKKPFTGAMVEAYIPSDSPLGFTVYTGLGFSKVRWPDRWDADYGYQMAFDKAVMDIVRQLLDEGGCG
jgi:hypothetical protein